MLQSSRGQPPAFKFPKRATATASHAISRVDPSAGLNRQTDSCLKLQRLALAALLPLVPAQMSSAASAAAAQQSSATGQRNGAARHSSATERR